MQRKRRRLDDSDMRMNTYLATKRTQSVLDHAANLLNDPKKAEREARCFCKACFYSKGGLAGQAFTSQPCARCGSDETYTTTATDSLCLKCAKADNLCKHCGGDIAMNLERNTI
jgi:hypothetical protein